MEIVENKNVPLQERINAFVSLQNKTEEMCKIAFCYGIDICYFPESLLSEEFIIETFRYCSHVNTERELTLNSIPKKFWTIKVQEEAVIMYSENLKLVSYQDQTPKMISSLIRREERQTNPSSIKFANPLLITEDVLESVIEDYHNPPSYSIASKYMELLQWYNYKCDIAKQAIEVLNSHKNS